MELNERGVTLPAPTGAYPVGRATYYWRDAGHGRPPSTDPSARRELVAWIWYAAAPEPNRRPAAYLPSGWEAVGQFWGFKADAVQVHASSDAPVATAQARYPVLIFSPAGFPPLSLTAILEEIASHGYVVVGVNHTRESSVTVFPDGRVVPMDAERMRPVFGPFSGSPEDTFRDRAAIADDKAADIRFVVDRSKRSTPARIGWPGGSTWIASAPSVTRSGATRRWSSAGWTAAANLDGGIWNAVGQVGLDRPAMLIMADHAEFKLPCQELVRMGAYPTVEWCQAERALTVGGWQTVYERGRPGYSVMIEGSGHISFMDVPFLPIQPGSMVAGGLATMRIDSRRAWRIICDYLLAFFARHLDGAPAPLPDGPSARYPETKVGAPKDLLAPAAPDPRRNG